MEEKGRSLDEKVQGGRTVRASVEAKRAEQAVMQDERKELERRGEELHREIGALEAEAKGARDKLRKTAPAHIIDGWRAVERICKEHKIEGAPPAPHLLRDDTPLQRQPAACLLFTPQLLNLSACLAR